MHDLPEIWTMDGTSRVHSPTSWKIGCRFLFSACGTHTPRLVTLSRAIIWSLSQHRRTHGTLSQISRGRQLRTITWIASRSSVVLGSADAVWLTVPSMQNVPGNIVSLSRYLGVILIRLRLNQISCTVEWCSTNTSSSLHRGTFVWKTTTDSPKTREKFSKNRAFGTQNRSLKSYE